MNLLDKLPDEILDIIYEYYWRDVFTNVLLDIKKPIILEQKINTFLNKYCMTQNYFNNVYTLYILKPKALSTVLLIYIYIKKKKNCICI